VLSFSTPGRLAVVLIGPPHYPHKVQSRCRHDPPQAPLPRAEVSAWMPPLHHSPSLLHPPLEPLPPKAKRAWRSNVSPPLFIFFSCVFAVRF
jgi:hypothetical protein